MDPLDAVQRMPSGRGPWGTVEGDCWLADDSEIGRRVTEGSPDLHFVVEIVRSKEDGELTESFYTTANSEMVARARRGRQQWDATGRHTVARD